MDEQSISCCKWGCNKWGLKGYLGALPGNRPKSAVFGRFRPFSAFFAVFRRVQRAPGKFRKRRKKAFFLRYPQICLNPHLLNPHLRHSKAINQLQNYSGANRARISRRCSRITECFTSWAFLGAKSMIASTSCRIEKLPNRKTPNSRIQDKRKTGQK